MCREWGRREYRGPEQGGYVCTCQILVNDIAEHLLRLRRPREEWAIRRRTMKIMKFLLLFVVGILLFSWAKQRFSPPAEKIDQDPVKIKSATLLVLESYPMRVSLALRGELPSACHALVWEVAGPNDKNIIEITTYAESEGEKFCIQILEPFEVQIPLGSFTELGFRVRLNGEDL